jgi:hypothetical protein
MSNGFNKSSLKFMPPITSAIFLKPEVVDQSIEEIKF